MWPKMLFEVLPHLARLIPLADKFFAGRSASEKAQEAALASLAQGVRGDLGQVTEAHTELSREVAGLSGQIGEQGAALGILIAGAGDEARRTRAAVESAEARISRLETSASTVTKLLGVALMMLAVTLVLLVIVLMKLHGR